MLLHAMQLLEQSSDKREIQLVKFRNMAVTFYFRALIVLHERLKNYNLSLPRFLFLLHCSFKGVA